MIFPSSPVCPTAVFEAKIMCGASTTGAVVRVDLMTVLSSATYACCCNLGLKAVVAEEICSVM